MKKVLSVALSCLLGVTLLSGCSGTNDSATLNVAIGGQITSLDPGMADDTYSMNVIQNMYRTLFKVDQDGVLVNDLCESYELSEDGLTYTFTIKDANWSDGQAITAADFVYAIKRGITYGPENAWHAQDARMYIVGAQDAFEQDLTVDEMGDDGVEYIDEKTFAIHLSQPVMYFDRLMTGGIYTPLRADVAKEKDSTWSYETDVVVNGPYLPTSINMADGVELEKNTEYYDAENITLDKISFKVMEDSVAQLSAYQSGEIDFATFVANEGYNAYEGEDDLYRVDPYVSNYFIDINSLSTTNTALQDVNVRLAMAKAINRDDIVTALDNGDYATPLYGLVPRGIQGASKDFREEGDEMGNNITFDLAGAQEIMTGLGYSADNLLVISYKTTGQQVHLDIAQILQAQLKEAYIDLKITQVEQGVFYDQVDGGDFETSRYGMSATTLDPYAAYLMMWRKDSMETEVFSDETFENIMIEATSETDATRRMELLHEGENYLINEQVYFIPLVTNTTVMLKKPSIQGIERTPAAIFRYEYVTME